MTERERDDLRTIAHELCRDLAEMRELQAGLMEHRATKGVAERLAASIDYRAQRLQVLVLMPEVSP